MSPLERVWKYREEVLYPRLFGQNSNGIFALNGDIFTEVFKQEAYDPRWLFLGVFEFAPTPNRGTWLYVTSGGSTPWEQESDEYNPEEYSWLGFELAMETPEKSEWPIIHLQRVLAYNVLICHSKYGDTDPLGYGNRIPLGKPVVAGSAISHVMLAEPEHYPATHTLESGKFDFLHVIGISAAENDYATQAGSDELLKMLKKRGAFPCTDANRASIV